MNRISEAEINSCTRRFLLENNFEFLSTKNNGEKFYYQIKKSHPPLYKQPDCICYKQNIVIVWEEKTIYNNLFRESQGKVCDIEKLHLLINSKEIKKDFIDQIANTIEVENDKIVLIGGVNSLKPKTNKKLVPNDLVHLQTEIINFTAKIELLNTPIIDYNFFPKRIISHQL